MKNDEARHWLGATICVGFSALIQVSGRRTDNPNKRATQTTLLHSVASYLDGDKPLTRWPYLQN